jgi:hypothetical protein
MTSQSRDLEAEFKTRIDLPSGGGDERGFDAILAALSPELTTTVDPSGCISCKAPQICVAGGCRQKNYGFRRPGVSLEVLTMSDEDDASSVDPGAVVAKLAEDTNPLLGHFVRVHGLLPGSAATCTSFFEPTPRWDTLILETGGVRHDICGHDFVPAIEEIAGRVFGLRTQFPLSRHPVPSSIHVSVDGQPVSGSIEIYLRSSRSFVILPTAPAEGAQIEITYDVNCAEAP